MYTKHFKVKGKIMKKITAIVITTVMITGFAQAKERSFKAPVAEAKVIKIMTQSVQSDGWSIVKKSTDMHFIIEKKYTKRVIMNYKPIKRVQGDVFVEVSFTKDGYQLQAVNAEGKVQNSLSYKEQRVLSALKIEVEKHLARTLI